MDSTLTGASRAKFVVCAPSLVLVGLALAVVAAAGFHLLFLWVLGCSVAQALLAPVRYFHPRSGLPRADQSPLHFRFDSGSDTESA